MAMLIIILFVVARHIVGLCRRPSSRDGAQVEEAFFLLKKLYSARQMFMGDVPCASQQPPGLKGGAPSGEGDDNLRIGDDFIVGSGRFIFDIAAEVVTRMGGRPKSTAQQKACRMLAARLMKEHGHRPMHIVRDLPAVTLLILTPTALELCVEKYIACDLEFDPTARNLQSLLKAQSRTE
jgi:hypothetical protein